MRGAPGGATVLLVVGLLAATTAEAQTRPLRTEEATTAPGGSLLLEIGGEIIQAEPNFLTGRVRDRWDAPLLRLTYSPADPVELDLEWVGRVGALDDPDFGSVSDFGDVTLRAKVRFRDLAPGRSAFAARFGVTLPETSFGNGLGPNALRMTAEALLTQSLGGTLVHLNLGLGISDEVLRPHEQRDFLSYGVAIVHPFGRLSLLAEIAGLRGKGKPGAEEHSEARAGFRWQAGRLRWDAAVRRGLLAADGRWGVTAGLSWQLGPVSR